MNNYPYLKSLTDKYNKALNTNSKELRISTIELGLALGDITKLTTSVSNIEQKNDQILQILNTFMALIQNQNDNEGF